MKKLFKILAACVFVCAMAVSCSSPSNGNSQSNNNLPSGETIGTWEFSPSPAVLYHAELHKADSYFVVTIVPTVKNIPIHTYAGICTKNGDTYSTNSISFDNGEFESGEISVTINGDGSATIKASFDPEGPRALKLNNAPFGKVNF